MVLYNLLSYNVEIQYKNSFLSKAMLLTIITTSTTLILPFIIAYISKGFWLKSHYFYEQPVVKFNYEYLIVAETDDPSELIVCGDTVTEDFNDNKHCSLIQVMEYDYNEDDRNDMISFKIVLNHPSKRTISSVILLLGLDFQIKTVCPLHMQSLAVINKDLPAPSSGIIYHGDIEFHQTVHLSCVKHHTETKYNISVLRNEMELDTNTMDSTVENYFTRELSTLVKTIYSRSHIGHTGITTIRIHLRVPEVNVRYTPSVFQELKWAWPQYLSLVVIFNWFFNKIKLFIFHNKLLMIWKFEPKNHS